MLDVTKPDTIAASLKTITAWTEQSNSLLVGLVNNAGISKGLPVELAPLELYREG